MIERLYLKEAARMLGYNDTRSIRKWCTKNGEIPILYDEGSNRPYIIKAQFEAAADKQIHEQLQKYFNCSPTEFTAHMQVASAHSEVKQLAGIHATKESKYHVKGDHAKSKLTRLLKIIECNTIRR